jgi:Protein of unknown function (DUF2971)
MKLYHYTNVEGLVGILNSGSIHFTNNRFLNDEWEGKYLYKILDELIEEDKQYKIVKTLCNTLFNDFMFKHDFYISSFCQKPDLLTMWNRYTNGNGVCLEFEMPSSAKTIAKLNKIIDEISLIKVTYNYKKNKNSIKKIADEIRLLLAKIYESNIDKFKNEDRDVIQIGKILFNEAANPFIKLFIDSAFMKHHAYKDEVEYRFAMTESVSPKFIKDNVAQKISNKGVLIEYVPIKFDIQKVLKSVLLHPASEKAHLDGITCFIKRKFPNLNIEVTKSNIPFRFL